MSIQSPLIGLCLFDGSEINLVSVWVSGWISDTKKLSFGWHSSCRGVKSVVPQLYRSKFPLAPCGI